MQKQQKSVTVPPNPKHVRQTFWQIWVPLLLTVFLVLAAAVFSVLSASSGSGKTGQWAGISIIWLILPMIPAGFIFLLFIAGMIYLIAKALRILPIYLQIAQIYVQIFGTRVTSILDRLIQPVIRIRGSAAGWKAVWKPLKRA